MVPRAREAARTGRDRSRGRDYAHDTASEDEHRELARALHSTRATVLLSGYASPLYDEIDDGWHRLDLPVPRPSASHADRDRQAVEVSWSNRPLRQMGDLSADPECDETPGPLGERDETVGCGFCGGPVARASTGRPRASCSRSCQARAYRARKAAEDRESGQTLSA